jgi:hypothetical protein
MSAINTSALNLWSLFEKESSMDLILLIGTTNWKLFSGKKKTEYVLTEPYHDDLLASVSAADRKAYKKRCDVALNASCLTLATISFDLQI